MAELDPFVFVGMETGSLLSPLTAGARGGCIAAGGSSLDYWRSCELPPLTYDTVTGTAVVWSDLASLDACKRFIMIVSSRQQTAVSTATNNQHFHDRSSTGEVSSLT